MSGDRRARILSLLYQDHPGLHTDRLCQVCAEATGMSGAGIMLMSGDIARGSICTTDPVSALIEDLQYLLGEGPCVDAYQSDQPVASPDLARDPEGRWLAFSGAAVEAGARAVFGFPLQIGAIRLGALNLHRDRPGSMTDEQHADALVLAEIAAQAVLLLQADAAPGEVAEELERAADFRYVVHQASGMVAAQLGISVSQALVRLRGRAFADGRPLQHLAEDVVCRRVRYDPAADSEPDDSTGPGP